MLSQLSELPRLRVRPALLALVGISVFVATVTSHTSRRAQALSCAPTHESYTLRLLDVINAKGDRDAVAQEAVRMWPLHAQLEITDLGDSSEHTPETLSFRPDDGIDGISLKLTKAKR